MTRPQLPSELAKGCRMQSVIAIRREIAAGRVTPGEAIAESFARIRAQDAQLSAFETLADEAALEFPSSGPLAGIAVGVKDIFDTADLITGYGSTLYRGHRPRADAALVAMIRGAGGAILGKTVTTEFAFFQPGKTVNPHNRAHTPGGSSSGSAAAVAAGISRYRAGPE